MELQHSRQEVSSRPSRGDRPVFLSSATSYCSASLAMDTKYVRLFIAALEQGNDAVALSLLEKGHVTVHSLASLGKPAFFAAPCAMLVPAIYFEREKVVRDLLRRGANLDKFIDIGAGSVNAVGLAVLFNRVSMLSLFHGLGAGMSDVFKPIPMNSLSSMFSHFESIPESVLDASIIMRMPACLVYALDSINIERPIELNPRALCALCMGARSGIESMELFQILRTRGFNFDCLTRPSGFKPNSLGELDNRAGAAPGEDASELSFSDLLLMSAQKSGNADLMRYIVRDLGMVSDSVKTDAAFSFLDSWTKKLIDPTSLGLSVITPQSPDAELVKYKCAACLSLCATMKCTGCKVTRYCSKDCQGTHWKTGGHKKWCKNLQKNASQASTDSAVPT